MLEIFLASQRRHVDPVHLDRFHPDPGSSLGYSYHVPQCFVSGGQTVEAPPETCGLAKLPGSCGQSAGNSVVNYHHPLL